jgi:ribose transport system ATP-binding protein
MNTGVLEAQGLTKIYPGTVALDQFTARFASGRVHALIGKNGSGKSTLIRLFSGAESPSAGTIRMNGRPLALHTPPHALREGIVTVYQELSLVPGLTVTENILLGRLPRRCGLVDWRAANTKARALLDRLHVDVPETVVAGSLSVARQQMVEIAKAMSFNPSVLLLDEPTSALARHETQSLFDLVLKLRGQGVTILYITHRMHELPRIADDVTILRDGRCAGVLPIAEATSERIVDLMFGDVAHQCRTDTSDVGEHEALAVTSLTREPCFRNVTFSLRRGEILGIAGMLGSGRSALLRSIFGADHYDRGDIRIDGRLVPAGIGPSGMKAFGLAMTPENRKEEGLVQSLSIRANMSMAGMRRIARRGFVNRRVETAAARRQIDSLDIKTGSLESPVSSLSGGNQQKVIIGNWLNNAPSVMFLDEPTRGIDIHAKQQVFHIMRQLSQQGLSCVFVSTELEELIDVCHRILVMRNGEVVAERDAASIRLDALYALCMNDPERTATRGES